MNKKLKPALISGIPLGIVFALPELDYLKASLNYVKLVCCALYGTSGVLAAGIYLRNLSTPPASPYGDGVVVGLLAGSFFSVADTFTRMLMRLSGYSSEYSETLAYMDAMELNGISAMSSMAFVHLSGSVVLGAIFGTLGGLLGIAFFRRV